MSAESGLQRLDSVNTRLETSGEQILALGLEHRLVAGAAEAARDTGLVLDTFVTEVARLRALDTGLLGEITTNRDTMQRLAASKARGGRQLSQHGEGRPAAAPAGDRGEQRRGRAAGGQPGAAAVTNNVTKTSPHHVILSPSTCNKTF